MNPTSAGLKETLEGTKKVAIAAQTRFKSNLTRYIADHPQLIPHIKQAAQDLDQEFLKRGPSATFAFYQRLGDNYEEFSRVFDRKIQEISDLV